MFANRRSTLLILYLLTVSLSFWIVSRYPALGSKAAMSGVEGFQDPLTPQAHFLPPQDAGFLVKVAISTLNWYETNWKGMVFGLLLAGGFLTLLSYLPKKPSPNRWVNSVRGLLVGTPLGVCVNCVAPIAKGLYEAGSKIETALAVMFSSPTLNIVVLTMLFSMFPFYMVALKLGATFLLILVIVPLLSSLHADRAQTLAAPEMPETVCAIDDPRESWRSAFKVAITDYWRSMKYIVLRTVPLMLLAGVLGALLSHLWSFELLIGMPVSLATLSFMAFMGTFLPLPIAFDLMLAQAMMMSGLGDGFVMTSLFTFGTFSIYSAMIVLKTFNWKLAVQLYIVVSALGVAVGFAAGSYSDWRHTRWLSQYDKVFEKTESPAIAPETAPPLPLSYPTVPRTAQQFYRDVALEIKWVEQSPAESSDGLPFKKIPGPELGLDYSNALTPDTFFDPLYFGRGLASGDWNRDGWTDLVVATDNGFRLYQNIDGKRFRPVRVPEQAMKGKQTLNVALVDLDNDGFLDVFSSAFGGGNHVWLNPLGKAAGQNKNENAVGVTPLPGTRALLTSATAFADWNRDGLLDMVYGNYYLGNLTRTPIDTSVDHALTNNGDLTFTVRDLPGIPGQTHSALLSDFNADGLPDLAIGNDYRVADTYYYGTGEGTFKKFRKQDGVIPITTQNTMSIDTADFNNDLIPDMYLANIGMSRGIDVISNIFGREMQQVGQAFCDSGKSILDGPACRDLLKLSTLLNPERQNSQEHCLELESLQGVRKCMVTRLALVAARRNDPSLCAKISDEHALARTMCDKYFESRDVTMATDEEIPIKTLFNILLKGNADGAFTDISDATGIATAEWSWNARFADVDNDEWQDLFVVNGVPITKEFTANNFFHNQRGETFKASEREFGLDDYDHSSSYTFFDMDNDGDLDLITNTLYGPFKVFLNQQAGNHSITFKLRDERGNRYCVGCKMIVSYGENGERQQIREIKTSGGFHSYDAPVIHFGLGRFEEISQIEILWSTGETTKLLQRFPANREYRITRTAQGQ